MKRTPVLIAAACLLATLHPGAAARGDDASTSTRNNVSYIVQASSVREAAALVRQVGGDVRHELGIIRAVSAFLSIALKFTFTRSGSSPLTVTGTVMPG